MEPMRISKNCRDSEQSNCSGNRKDKTDSAQLTGIALQKLSTHMQAGNSNIETDVQWAAIYGFLVDRQETLESRVVERTSDMRMLIGDHSGIRTV